LTRATSTRTTTRATTTPSTIPRTRAWSPREHAAQAGTHGARAVDDETYQAGVKWLQSERFKNSRVLSRGDTLDILAVQLHLRHEAWRASKAPGRPRKIKFAEATAAILRRDSKICQRVWKEYVEEAKVSTATDSGPRGVKFPKVKLSKRLLRALREWMHEREVQRERTVAKDVLQSGPRRWF